MHTTRPAPQLETPVFTAPVRWTLRALAWLAFATSAWLAWHAVTETHVAGCGIGGGNGCDMVLGSTWSKWLGVPVAVPGLACYATLAALSVLLGVRKPRLARWINTAFLMLTLAAAIASVWFLAVQVLAIGHYCLYCIVTDLCGIALGAIAAWFSLRWLQDTRYLRQARGAAPGLMALRTALPAGKRSTPIAAPRQFPTPSLAVALGGAAAIVALLVGGQILYPAKSYEMQQVALDETIEMNGQNGEPPAISPSLEADTRIAMRLPADSPGGDNESQAGNSHDSGVVTARYEEPAPEPTTEAADDSDVTTEEPPAEVVKPKRERIVSFLDGKLKLDIYKHPHIGSPEAPHVLVELVSYNCVHCRNTHRTMKRALSRYGDQVAVIVMVIPFERECNKLITSAAASHRGACATARMALGVASLKPAAFVKFHDWLMAGGDNPPQIDSVVARAYSLVNRDRLRELSGGEQLKKQIEGYVNLFAALRKQNASNKEFGLPVQILGDHVMSGTVDKPADLYKAWEEHLGVNTR